MKFNQKFYEKYGYKVTDEPIYTHGHRHLAPLIEQLHHTVAKPTVSQKTIAELEDLTALYPDVLSFTNYLYIAYIKINQSQKGFDYLKSIVQKHPNYLFGITNLAAYYYSEGLLDQASDLLKEPYDVRNIEKGEYIHETALIGYINIVIKIELKRGNIDKAKNLHRILFDYDKKHEAVIRLGHEIIRTSLVKSLNRQAPNYRKIESISKPISGQFLSDASRRPIFNHTEINKLYEYSIQNIPETVIRSILALPKQTLIQDLQHVLFDRILRLEYFYENEDWSDETHHFGTHAVYLLTELKAYDSLPIILDVLRQDEAFSDYWFSDWKEDYFNEPIYILGEKQLDLLKTFVLEENLYTWHRLFATDAVAQVILKQPERREEGIKWFRDVIHHHLDNADNDNLIDSVFLGMMISDILNCRAIELKKDIEQLFATGWVSNFEAGKLEDVLAELETPIDPYQIKPLPDNIFELYNKEYHKRRNKRVSRFEDSKFFENFNEPYETFMRELALAGISEMLGGKEKKHDAGDDEDDYDDDEDWTPPQPVKREESKVGRNDPCPCGSGKKYKKCHGK